MEVDDATSLTSCSVSLSLYLLCSSALEVQVAALQAGCCSFQVGNRDCKRRDDDGDGDDDWNDHDDGKSKTDRAKVETEALRARERGSEIIRS